MRGESEEGDDDQTSHPSPVLKKLLNLVEERVSVLRICYSSPKVHLSAIDYFTLIRGLMTA